MHGRVKVKTSEEQKAAKEKERAKRAQKYVMVRNAIVTKRASGGVDAEVIKMTTGLLGTLPDFATMWNWRREGLITAWAELSKEEQQKECETELSFLNGCLGENPKSYSVWYQRRWVMQRAPLPPWKEELENCNFFLKKDERNFHCWDYRRWVVKNSTHESAEAAAEFAYTLSKISDQFSNYSAWHYRSTLLPKVCPADGDEAAVNSVSQDALGEEFSMLASAFYIDPCDQAAWIYHRWLLGREETPPSVCAAYTAEDATCIHLVYSHPVSVNSEAVTVSDAEGNPLEVAWTAGNGASASRAGRRVPSSLWAVRRPNNAAFPETVSLKFDGGVTSTSGLAAAPFASAVPAAGSGVYYSAGGELLQRLARYRLPSAALLCEQLDMCTELLEELDDGPEKKWPLLATVYILYGLDPMVHRDQILSTIADITKIDPNRRGYYDDVKSKYEWEWAVNTSAETGHPKDGALNMTGKSLTSTHHLGHFFRLQTLDLSDNSLLRLEGLAYLRNLVSLVLDNNRLAGFYDTLQALPKLATLSACNNAIQSVRGLEGLRDHPALKELKLAGNPVCTTAEFAEFAQASLPYLVPS